MNAFFDDFTRDIPRGLSTRYLKQQTAPQARWQSPDVIYERKVLEYDPRNPGAKILIGALGPFPAGERAASLAMRVAMIEAVMVPPR